MAVAACLVKDLTHMQEFIVSMISMNAPAGAISLTQGTQSSFFINRIRKMSDLSPMDAAALTTLAQAGPWSPEEKLQLVDAIASVLAGAAASSNGHRAVTRRQNQEMQHFNCYLTKSDIQVLVDVNTHVCTKLDVIVKRCLRIGLDIPSELTIQHMVAVLCGLAYASHM